MRTLSPMTRLLFVCSYVAFGTDPAFGAAPPVVLTQIALPRELPRLRTPNNTTSYTISEPLTLTTNETWYVTDLYFGRDGRIYLGENSLDLTIRGVLTTTNQVAFQSFPDSARRAPNGRDGPGATISDAAGSRGQPGQSGRGAGNLSLTLHKPIQGRVIIMLPGQDGGNGGNGGRGVPGAPGAAGTPGRSGVFGCERAATRGGVGGQGGTGGDAGNGGACGSGGVVRVHTRKELVAASSKNIDLRKEITGTPGRAGQPGLGGPGGPGGPGGSGGGVCVGGSVGAQGPTGNSGQPASDGLSCQPPQFTIDVIRSKS